MAPGSSPVPRWMARLMLSEGMFSALAASTAVRRRGLDSTSPPPARAAMAISLIKRVKILPRLASVAAFLCLIVAHLLCPDIVRNPVYQTVPAAMASRARARTGARPGVRGREAISSQAHQRTAPASLAAQGEG